MSTENSEMTEWFVKAPYKGDTPLREPLSEVDKWLCKASHWLGFGLRFDAVLDVNEVKIGLERTLQHIPALAARVDASNALYELVLDPDNQGVMLEYVQQQHDNIKLPDDSSPREAWTRAGLDAPAAGFSGEPNITDPLMRARLTIFKGVSFLSIGINHGLCDGHGICDILQVWSHFCTHDSVEGLPELLKRPRVFCERVTTPQRPASCKRELQDRLESDVGCTTNPYSGWMFFVHVLPRAIWCVSRQQVLELRVSASRLQELKEQVKAKLPKGEWVSWFEVLCASLRVAQQVTAPTSTPRPKTLHVACNLRGRAERFPKDYFGNAAFDFRQPMNLPPVSEYSLGAVTQTAQEIHCAVRRGLETPEDICMTKDWFEAARHLGYKNKYDIWAPVVMNVLKGDGVFVNNWDKRFLQVSLGSPKNASAMAVFFGVIQNLIIEVPRSSSGDSTIHLALPASHAKKFSVLCEEQKDVLPFQVAV